MLKTIGQIVSENLKGFRKQKGLRQDQAAHDAGVPLASFQRAEDPHANSTLETLQRIVEGLGIPVAELFRDKDLSPQITDDDLLKTLETRLKAPEKPAEPAIPADIAEMIARVPKDDMDVLRANLRGLLPPEPQASPKVKPREKSK